MDCEESFTAYLCRRLRRVLVVPHATPPEGGVGTAFLHGASIVQVAVLGDVSPVMSGGGVRFGHFACISAVTGRGVDDPASIFYDDV